MEIEEEPYILAEKGEIAGNVSVLLGSNKNEGSEFIRGLPMNASSSQYFQYIQNNVRGVNTSFLNHIAQLYPCQEYESCWWAATYLMFSFLFSKN